jgi:predicted metal-dependent HD superfamily phosphohydrolase
VTHEWLRSRWSAAAGASGAAASEGAFDDVVRRHGEPHRRYHTLDHISAVVSLVEEWADLAYDAATVTLAAFLHDVIYDPQAKDNEERSAAYAREVLRSVGVTDTTVDEVARLIALTATHSVAQDDANGAVLCDADLSILGASPETYDRYVDNVRAEYSFVSDDAWRSGRTALLEDFLRRPRLFVTERAHDRFDAAARGNLSRELASLR